MAFQEIFTNGFMLAMVMAREAKTQVAGVTVVCDAAGFTFKHLRSLAITDMKLLAMVVQVKNFGLGFGSLFQEGNLTISKNFAGHKEMNYVLDTTLKKQMDFVVSCQYLEKEKICIFA